MTKDEVLELLNITPPTGKTHCPAHEDDKASLSVTITEEDKILVCCHAGCEQSTVLRSLEKDYGITTRDLGNGSERQKRVVSEYVYRDAGGVPVFKKIRFEPKDFVIDPAGAPTNIILYRLPELLAAGSSSPVIWVEGEKAVDRLKSHGIVSTTLGGASKSAEGACKVLKGRRVVILPDNDDAGRKHAEAVKRNVLLAGAHQVRILALPGLPVKGDVCDWLDQGNTVPQLLQLINQSLGTATFSVMKPVSPGWIWQPRFPSTGLTIVFGEAGLGKTTVLLDMVSRWSTGRPMPESAGQYSPINVAVYGFEDNVESVILPRLMAAGADLSKVHLLLPDPKRPVLPDQVDYFKQVCKEVDAKVMIFDNIENAMQSGVDTNNSRSLRSTLNPLSDFGIPVIAIHHPRKGSRQGAANEAMSGSQAYTNIARSTMMILPTGNGNDIALTQVKNSYAPVSQTRTLYYRIGTRQLKGLGEHPVIEWLGGDYVTAEDWLRVLRTQERDISKNDLLQGNVGIFKGGSAPLASATHTPPLAGGSLSLPVPEIPESRSFPASASEPGSSLGSKPGICQETISTISQTLDSKTTYLYKKLDKNPGLVKNDSENVITIVRNPLTEKGVTKTEIRKGPIQAIDPWVQSELEKAIRNGVIEQEED